VDTLTENATSALRGDGSRHGLDHPALLPLDLYVRLALQSVGRTASRWHL